MKNRTLFASICLLLLFSACSKSPKIKIKGNIGEAEGKMLYFELSGINKTQVLDSVKLDKEGDFHFKAKLPGSPEFYRLRIEDRFIQLGADSSAEISIQASGKKFGTDYKVQGSRPCELIRNLSVSQAKILASVDSLSLLYKNKQLSDTAFQKKIDILVNTHRELSKKAILEDPRSPAAYYSIFQRIHGLPLFDPFDKSDNRLYSAVATSWDSFYPKTDRSKNIVNLALQGLKAIRQERDRQKLVIHEQDKISYFQITLPNINGRIIPLSSLAGKVVLLDFTAYQSEFSPSRNLKFRDLYNQYSKQGFEIYQVSLDTDENFWKTGAANLPWICVHDKSSIQSPYLSVYNVQELPTFFLLDRSGNIVARDAMVSNLNNAIMKLL